MNKLLTLAIVFSLLFVLPKAAEGKLLPQARKGSPLVISPRLRKDRNALLVTFSNTQTAEAISYTLLYQTNGQDEGAVGSVDPSRGSATRELLFGTCSRNVCRYHSNITNMKLEVVAKLTSGRSLTKRYRIRV